MVVSTHLQDQAVLLPGRYLRNTLERTLSGRRALLDAVAKTNIPALWGNRTWVFQLVV